MRPRYHPISCVLLAALGLGSASVAQPADLELAVVLRDSARVPPAVMREAKAEVERTFLASGVRVVWSEPGPVTAAPLTVIVREAVTPGPPREDPTGEVILGKTSPCGTLAQVFYRRIVAAVERRQISVGVALARVISHELGHLLLPAESHAPFGLMRRAVDLDVPSLRDFSDEQSRLLRDAAASRQNGTSRCRP